MTASMGSYVQSKLVTNTRERCRLINKDLADNPNGPFAFPRLVNTVGSLSGDTAVRLRIGLLTD